MKITKAYLLANRTKNKAWTKAQMDVLGITWPPRKGWMQLIMGKELDKKEQELFEKGKSVTCSDNTKTIKRLINKMSQDELESLIYWIAKLNASKQADFKI